MSQTQVKQELFLAEEPYASVNGEGQHIGYPVIFVRTQGCPVGCIWCDAMMTWPEKKGNENVGKKYTFEELANLLDEKFPTIRRIWFTGGEPTIHAKAITSFIRYYKRRNTIKRIWHLITAGWIFDAPLLYTVDWITIDVKPPSSKTASNEDFIGWCIMDAQIAPKLEFKMVVANTIEDTNFALQNIAKLGKFPWTIQPLYWSEAEAKAQKKLVDDMPPSQDKDLMTLGFLANFQAPVGYDNLEEFTMKFLEIVNNPNVRILTQYHKIVFPGKLNGI